MTNQAPTISAGQPRVTKNEGQTATNSGAFGDPAGGSATLTASVGSVTNNGNGTWSWSFSTSDGPNDTQLVTITAKDSAGLTGTTTFLLVVNNVAPTLTVNRSPIVINVGASVTNSGTFADVGQDIVDLSASVGTITVNPSGTWSWSSVASDEPQLVTITATDDDGAQRAAFFMIFVNALPPSVPTDGNLAANLVAENAANGTTVGVTAFSTDPAGRPVTYHLSDDAGGRFTIDETSGVISVANGSLLDFEVSSSHTVAVYATDESGLASASRTFTIQLQDVPEVLRINPTDWSSGSLTLLRDNNLLRVRRTGTTTDVASNLSASLTGIEFTGRDVSAETLTVDFSGGSPLVVPISFAGGTGNDTVVLSGLSTAATTVNYDLTLSGAVGVLINSESFTTTNIEKFVDSLPSATRSFVFGSSDDRVTISDDGTVSNGMSRLALTNGPTVEFKNPTSTITLNAGAGRDTLDVTGLDSQFSASLTINGGDGNDLLNGSALPASRGVTLNGEAGNDTLQGGAGADSINGGSENDSLVPGAGNDTLSGGTEDDAYVFRNAATSEFDLVIESANQGIDLLDFSALTVAVSVNLALSATDVNVVRQSSTTSAATASSPVTVKLGQAGQAANFENLIGGSGADSLTGNDQANRLQGNGGSDSLIGGLGDDTYVFGAATTAETDTLTETNGAGAGTADVLDFSLVPAAAAATATTVSLNLNSNATTATTLSSVTLNRTLSFPGGVARNFFENVFGSAGHDNLTGGDAANRLEGRGGNDTLLGGIGNETLLGGFGDDIYKFADIAAGPAEIDNLIEVAGEGIADTLDFSLITATNVAVTVGLNSVASTQVVQASRTLAFDAGQFENVTGGSGNDTLTGNSASNRLNGGTGSDSLAGSDNDDTLFGGTGSDQLAGGNGDDTYLFQNGLTSAETDTLTEVSGSDSLDFSLITSATTKVTVDLSSAQTSQIVHGTGTSQRTLIFVATDFENITGGATGDLLTGSGAANRLDGRGGNDTLIGGGGDDTYVFRNAVGTESDRVVETSIAGAGSADVLDFSAQTVAVTLDFNSTSTALSAGGRTLTFATSATGTPLAGDKNLFEHAIGGSANDTFKGSTTVSGANRFDGGGGNDTLSGGAGNDALIGGLGVDSLSGEAGNDTLIGGGGSDKLLGGNDNDRYVFEEVDVAETDTLTETAGTGTGTLDHLDFSALAIAVSLNLANTAGNTTTRPLATLGNRTLLVAAAGQVANFEVVTGGSGNDLIVGSLGKNVLIGGNGNDTLQGGGDSDTLVGGDGNDSLFGEAGADTLLGGLGADQLTGGTESDLLLGEDGIDTLSGEGGADSLDNSLGTDSLIADGADTIGLFRFDLAALLAALPGVTQRPIILSERILHA